MKKTLNKNAIKNNGKKLIDYIRLSDYDFDIVGHRGIFSVNPMINTISVSQNLKKHTIVLEILNDCTINKRSVKIDERPKRTDDICVIFGTAVSTPLIVYVITYILYSLFEDGLIIYVGSEEFEKRQNIIISHSINFKDNISNISRPIKPFEILGLDLTDLLKRRESDGKETQKFDGRKWHLMTTSLVDSPFGDFQPFDISLYIPSEKDIATKHATLKRTIDENNERRYEKYNGAHGYDDDTIDSAFEGDPDNCWNVD